MHGNGIGAYQQAAVITADPKRLVLMCYEEAIKNLKIAQAKYLSRDYEEKAKALAKAEEIIAALNSALDFEKGGEIALNLHTLYNYMVHSLMEADLKRDIKGMDHVISMLAELKSAWEEIISGNATDTESDLRNVDRQETKILREMRA